MLNVIPLERIKKKKPQGMAPKPLSREDMIKVAKLGKGKTNPWEDKHFAEVEPKKIEGFHVLNESDATVHIVRVNDVYIIYVEPQLAVNELTRTE